jgi:hypothetical protein
LPLECGKSRIDGHLQHGVDQRLVAQPIGVDEQGQQFPLRPDGAVLLGKRDQPQPPFAPFRRIGARAGIKKRQPRHALGSLADNLIGDVSPHRKAREREALWCRGENGLGDLGHAVVVGVIGDREIGNIAQSTDLWRP